MPITAQGNAAEKERSGAQQPLVRPATVTLPKGGGAIRGMGEKFAANPVTGTGSMTVPLATSPGRAGFGPQLALSYDSGAGNGPFGFGSSLSLPAITRKTDKGLPRYDDAGESDVFILSGAEDLVPVLKDDGSRWSETRTVGGGKYLIHRYRPRIEGLFARIERWTHQASGAIHWRSITRDNVTTLYGRTTESRIADPADPSRRIFSWLICQSYDDKGNAVVYQYQSEDSQRILEDPQGQSVALAHERNRDDASRSANRYLKGIKYGNRTPNRDAVTWQATDPADLLDADWMFEVVFDYGEGHYSEDVPDPDGRVFAQATIAPPPGSHWPVRQDPFSAYRAGFEVRTYRLCRRVLLFHHFPQELGIKDYLVRSTQLAYAESPIASFITGVTQSGYVRRPIGDQPNRYLKASLPPVEFEYSQAVINQDVQVIEGESLENLPSGLDGATYQWTDLDGDGVAGILTEQAGGWFFKRNLSPINQVPDNGTERTVARLGPVEPVATRPAPTLAGGQAQFMDLAGDGQLDLVTLEGPVAGFYERTDDAGWKPFREFASSPTLDTRDPNVRFVDLDGDGHADILVSGDEVFSWHPSLAELGFGPARTVRQAGDEERGPRLVFADGTNSIYLADLSGDGLTDLVRIRNGEICYWPNLGYGRFGAKVTMDGAPWLDAADQFDQRRIRLGDIDGSGTTDLFYLGRDGITIWRNHCGNGWSAPQRLDVLPPADNLAAVTVVDLLGNGTACLVWSSPLPGVAGRQMRYVDLMGGEKPHLLIKVVNNLGAETRVRYAPSTKFYLRDEQDGKPWITRLPFPVHVVERVETYDRISRNRFVTRYAYHHGYFDGEEREFRGFGMVEQVDTEEFAALAEGGALPDATNIDASSHVPPVRTRTWSHTGAYLGRNHVSDFFAGLLDEHDVGEYYREPGLTDPQARELLLDDTVLPAGLTVEEEREACRALKGSMLRQEVYARDGTDEEDHPYIVTEQSFSIRRLQSRAGNRHAVFFAHPRESISYHYERDPADPRVAHALTLEVDAFGNVRKSAAVGYGRRQTDPDLEPRDRDKQGKPLVTYTENDYTNPVEAADDYRAPLLCEARTYELTNYEPTGADDRFQASDFDTFDGEIPYEGAPASGRQRRLIERVRSLYRRDDLTALLPLGALERLALPGETYKLAFTPGLLAQTFKRKLGAAPEESLLPDPAQVLGGAGGAGANQGGYMDLDGNGHWWIPSGRIFYGTTADPVNPALTAAAERTDARQHFFLPHKVIDPFAHGSTVDYDAHALFVVETEDALGNTVTAVHDYRVLQPALLTDPNGNRAQVAFDALGMVVGTAVKGKAPPAPVEGDTLDGFDADLPEAVMLDHLADPLADPQAILGQASTRLVYDLFAYHRTKNQADPQPAVVYTLARETHDADLEPGQQTNVQHSVSYSDGFGREVQKKIQAEPGPLVEGGLEVGPRWVGSGWTIFNNKGKPVRQYEPFFSDTHGFEFAKTVGVSPVLFYDPVERVVATLHPNHTWEKVVFDPWRQETWDVNDTVLLDPKADPDVGDFFGRLPPGDYVPTWHAARKDGQLGAAEQDAAVTAAAHAGTQSVAHMDSLGRTFLTIADNGAAGTYKTRVELDIEGNQREVIDALGRRVMTYDHDMLGTVIHSRSMEAGERWMLGNVAGNPIRRWDSRGHEVRGTYDALQRPTQLFVTLGAAAEALAERTVYGEGHPDAIALNLRAKPFQVFDGAGVVTSEAYDFKGNLLRSTRQLLQGYKNQVNWGSSPAPALEDETFTRRTTYDALNRPVTLTTPDDSVIRPAYNEANLLEQVHVNLPGAATETPFVVDIDYNAKGQRERIQYPKCVTEYAYDPLTFRLTGLRTTRAADDLRLQDLGCTYDPTGNITQIRDDAQQTIFFNNAVVEPSGKYEYDAIYRLIHAEGREHIGQSTSLQVDDDDSPRMGHAHPHDGNQMRRYKEEYAYDPVGNLLRMIHVANGGSWTRRYAYGEPSLIEPVKPSNRLSGTSLPGDPPDGPFTAQYTYDAHGNMTSMPHLSQMKWDFEDALHEVDLGGGGRAFYVYDAAGQRVRKVHEHNGSLVEERIYLGGFEIYRKRNASGLQLERETLHVMDDKRRIALVETKTVDAGAPSTALPSVLTRFQLDNHLGSASLELDEDGSIISYEEYHPYGTTSYQAGRSKAEVSLKRYRYTGKERDEETGLYYHGARYYAPWVGRWTSCDPGGVGVFNLYLYVSNRPVVLHDPSGGDGESFWDTFKPGGRVFEAVDKVVNPSREDHPALAAVMDNLDKRGKDLVEGTAQKLKETAEDYADIAYYSTHSSEPGAGQKLGAAAKRRVEARMASVKGVGQMVKRVGEAGGDIAYYHPELLAVAVGPVALALPSHRNEPGADAKTANAVTDVVLDAPQLALTVIATAGAARSVAGAMRAPKRPTPSAAPKFEPVKPEPSTRAPVVGPKTGTVASHSMTRGRARQLHESLGIPKSTVALAKGAGAKDVFITAYPEGAHLRLERLVAEGEIQLLPGEKVGKFYGSEDWAPGSGRSTPGPHAEMGAVFNAQEGGASSGTVVTSTPECAWCSNVRNTNPSIRGFRRGD